ncbi:hypothetical protein JKY72_03590 [Candidatus Gracilibacteria bacterium]|nr:hypothetical protein [Candidatus Gracilibacteria bacterium]
MENSNENSRRLTGALMVIPSEVNLFFGKCGGGVGRVLGTLGSISGEVLGVLGGMVGETRDRLAAVASDFTGVSDIRDCRLLTLECGAGLEGEELLNQRGFGFAKAVLTTSVLNCAALISADCYPVIEGYVSSLFPGIEASFIIIVSISLSCALVIGQLSKPRGHTALLMLFFRLFNIMI